MCGCGLRISGKPGIKRVRYMYPLSESSQVQERPDEITGPKKLNVFVGPYVWAIFMKFVIVEKKTLQKD